jgi:NAD(P)H-dependent FMN reductase
MTPSYLASISIPLTPHREASNEMNPAISPARGADRVAVIIGSTRPARICPGIAHWSREALGEDSPLLYEVIDLADVGLPFLDERFKPALRDYEHEHTKAWSSLISGYQGFVFVFPQYNWGYPAPLKNALDFLYYEWHGKPATSVTYGTRGGGKGADQIHQVFEGLHMRPLETRLEVVITDDQVDHDWQMTDLAATMRPYAKLIRQLDAEMIEALEDTQ